MSSRTTSKASWHGAYCGLKLTQRAGPHDAVFYKQLDELQDEYDALRASGYSGEGFLGNGTRVGVGVGHDTGVSMKEARKIALTKLEKRMKLQRLLGTGGRLGGATPDMKGKRRGDILADVSLQMIQRGREQADGFWARRRRSEGCEMRRRAEEGTRTTIPPVR